MSSMASSPMGKVTFEDERATIEFERYYGYPVQKIWEALTDNSQLSSWFLSKVRMEGGPGGFVESWFGFPTFHVTGKIRIWNPPHILEHEWNIEPSQALPEGEFSVMRWELEEKGVGTVLRLTHRNLTRQTISGLRTGLDPAPAEHLILERLEVYLSSSGLKDMQIRMSELMAEYHRMLQK